MLQSSRLGNSLNAITSLLVPSKVPALVVLSMRGDAGEWNDAQADGPRRPICDAVGLPHSTADTPEATAETVRLLGQTAFGTQPLGVCIPPRRLTPFSFAMDYVIVAERRQHLLRPGATGGRGSESAD